MNALGAAFVWILAGQFVTGSPAGEAGRQPDEVQHDVTISLEYWTSKHEVAQRESVAVMGSNPCAYSPCGPESPMDRVSWEDVQEFIGKLNRRTSRRGYTYRLPTEAEWQYAARAETTGPRCSALDKIAYAGNSGGKLSVPGWKRANAWGLYDTPGNVGKWTAGWYEAYGTYNGFAAADPTGPSTGSLRVYRGGSYSEVGEGVRAAGRRNGSPRTSDDEARG